MCPQRSGFSRFYFIGDDDLLAIIGGGTDAKALFRHLPKMFAGISKLLTPEEPCVSPAEHDQQKQRQPGAAAVLTGMGSREGESVAFVSPIITADYPSVNAMLTRIEGAMVRARAG